MVFALRQQPDRISKMTIQDLKQWNKSREEDVWWIRIEGETLGRKVNLEKIEQILDQKLDSEVMVLHVSQAAQRPRPWVEVERVKAAPVEKPHDNGLDGKETNGAYSGEREPRPAQNVDFDSSQGSFDQTPVSEPSPPSDLPPPPPPPPAQRKKKAKKGGVGLGRLGFFGVFVGIIFAGAFLSALGGGIFAALLAKLFLIPPGCSRMKNAGKSEAWAILSIVPFVSLFFYGYCFCLPTAKEND